MKQLLFWTIAACTLAGIILALIFIKSDQNTTESSKNLVTIDTSKYLVIKKNTGVFVDTTLYNGNVATNKPLVMLTLQIPLDKQPYPTPAYHYANKDGQLVAFVSAEKVEQNVCLAFHEFFEGMSCGLIGVTQHSIDSFDRQWIQKTGGPEEPGAELNAPYHWEHEAALSLEWQAFQMFWRLNHGEHIAFVQPNPKTKVGAAWKIYNEHMYELQQPTQPVPQKK